MPKSRIAPSAITSSSVAAALLVALAAPARAEIVTVAWDGAGRFDKEVSVPGGRFVEACVALPKDARVNWSFEAGAALDFNIHYHVGRHVVFPTQKDRAAAASGTLGAPVGQDFCWMWSNKGADAITLRFGLAMASAAR